MAASGVGKRSMTASPIVLTSSSSGPRTWRARSRNARTMATASASPCASVIAVNPARSTNAKVASTSESLGVVIIGAGWTWVALVVAPAGAISMQRGVGDVGGSGIGLVAGTLARLVSTCGYLLVAPSPVTPMCAGDPTTRWRTASHSLSRGRAATGEPAVGVCGHRGTSMTGAPSGASSAGWRQPFGACCRRSAVLQCPDTGWADARRMFFEIADDGPLASEAS